MKLSKKSIYYKTLTRTIGVLIVLAFIFPPILLLFLPILLAVGVYEYLYWKNYDFYIEEGDIKITSGVITRNKLDIPVRRVQNVDINRNIIHRIFDIAELKVETAGGTSTEAALRYLELEDAEQLRNEIRKLKDRRKSPETQEDTDGEDYVLTDKNLLMLSLIGHAPLTAAVGILLLGAALTGLTIFAETITQLIGGLILSVIGITVLTGLSTLFSATGTFTKYYGFSLERKNDAIEYEMGLINRQGATIPKEKIQTLIINENFLERYLGYATLKIETAGADTEEQINTSTAIIPFDKRENVVNYAEKIGKFQSQEFKSIDKRAKSRYFRRYILTASIIAVPIIGLIIAGFGPFLLTIPLLLALAARKASNLKWENIGYSTGKDNVFIRNGVWKRKTYVVPYFRVQNIVKTESIFQRRWNQATVTIDTAGSIWTNPKIIDLDREKASEVQMNLFEKFRHSIYQ